MNAAIQVWGHRGCRGSGNPPENSLEAFQAAIDQGADGFELDVFLTRDDQLVIFQVWGHRGCRGSGNPPENSLEAFQAAIDQGADGFELDVFLTRDDQLVVF